MTAVQSNEWLEGLAMLDDEAQAASSTSTRKSKTEGEPPFFVDIGGGHGHQSIQLLQKYPCLSGHIVLQDLPEAIDRLPPTLLDQGVRAVSQNFFHPQQKDTRGARFYYLRRILHDWPDAQCLEILGHLRDVMTSSSAGRRRQSRILIDEVVLPDVDAPWQAVMQDVSMGILFGGKERTQKQWESLVQKAGLMISEVSAYGGSSCNSVLVLEKA